MSDPTTPAPERPELTEWSVSPSSGPFSSEKWTMSTVDSDEVAVYADSRGQWAVLSTDHGGPPNTIEDVAEDLESAKRAALEEAPRWYRLPAPPPSEAPTPTALCHCDQPLAAGQCCTESPVVCRRHLDEQIARVRAESSDGPGQWGEDPPTTESAPELVPCQRCAMPGIAPYCAQRPCPCVCHVAPESAPPPGDIDDFDGYPESAPPVAKPVALGPIVIGTIPAVPEIRTREEFEALMERGQLPPEAPAPSEPAAPGGEHLAAAVAELRTAAYSGAMRVVVDARTLRRLVDEFDAAAEAPAPSEPAADAHIFDGTGIYLCGAGRLNEATAPRKKCSECWEIFRRRRARGAASEPAPAPAPEAMVELLDALTIGTTPWVSRVLLKRALKVVDGNTLRRMLAAARGEPASDPASPCDSLGAFLDDELSDAEAEAFRAHLAGCTACQAEAGEILALEAALAPVAKAMGGEVGEVLALLGSVPHDCCESERGGECDCGTARRVARARAAVTRLAADNARLTGEREFDRQQLAAALSSPGCPTPDGMRMEVLIGAVGAAVKRSEFMGAETAKALKARNEADGERSRLAAEVERQEALVKSARVLLDKAWLERDAAHARAEAAEKARDEWMEQGLAKDHRIEALDLRAAEAEAEVQRLTAATIETSSLAERIRLFKRPCTHVALLPSYEHRGGCTNDKWEGDCGCPQKPCCANDRERAVIEEVAQEVERLTSVVAQAT